MNVLVLHDTCTELVSYCISCCLVHQLSSLSGMLSTINRVSSKTEQKVMAKCPLVNTTLRYSRQDLHSLVQQSAKPHSPVCSFLRQQVALTADHNTLQQVALKQATT